jgi:hypothetical protein
MKNRNNAVCPCGNEIWAYMVKDEVWRAAGLVYTDFRCRECLNRLLGRPLVIEDFTDAPINWYNVPEFGEQLMKQVLTRG